MHLDKELFHISTCIITRRQPLAIDIPLSLKGQIIGQVSLGRTAVIGIMAGQHVVLLLMLLDDHDLLDDIARCTVHVVRALQIIGHIVFHYATS